MNKQGCSNCESLRTENCNLKIKLMKLNGVIDLNEQKLIVYHNLYENAKILLSSCLLEINHEVSNKIKKVIDEFEEWENQIDMFNYGSEQRSLNFIEIEEYHNESLLWNNFSNQLKRQRISGIENWNSTTQIPATQSRISSTGIQTIIIDDSTSEIKNPDSLLETPSSR